MSLKFRTYLRAAAVFAMLFVVGEERALAGGLQDRLGPLAQVVKLGDDIPWRAGARAGWFTLSNSRDDAAVRTYQVRADGRLRGDGVFRARVTVASEIDTPPGVAGLFMAHRTGGRFTGLGIEADGQVSLITGRPGNRFELAPSEVARARLDGNDLIEIREAGTSVIFALNGVDVFRAGPGQLAQGGLAPVYGILAAGRGRFGFRAVEIRGADRPIAIAAPAQRRMKAGDDRASATGAARRPFETARPADVHAAQILLGTTMAIFWHELGHALIGETRLPATGPEEDVADGFAAFVLGNAAQEAGFSPSERAFMAGIVRYSTLLWHYLDLYRQDPPGRQRHLAEHASEHERLRNSFCFIYGSDPAGYAAAADALNVSARTRVRCEAEYAKRNRAWETLLATVSRAQAEGGGRILLDLRPTDSPVGATVRRLLTSTGVMDRMMQRMERRIAWPRDLSVIFRDCATPNASYDAGRGRITVCYGLIEQFSTMVFEAERAGAGLSARRARSRRP